MSLYDITQTFEANVTYGPYWEDNLPQRPSIKGSVSFLGKSLNSAFGVSASPMTFTARSIELLGKLGYDLITYRSVRSHEWPGLPAPHWAYVDLPDQVISSDLSNPIAGDLSPFRNQSVSTANSFGVQSLKPEYWQREYELAKKSLSEGQHLILALMPSTENGADVYKDVRELAKLASETTAEIFEINLACPNSGSKALIYEDVSTATKVCAEIKSVLGDKPLLAKIGYFANQETLKEFMAATSDIITGISSTNTYSAPVTTTKGGELFPGRTSAGISGNAIRSLSLQQAKNAVQFRQELHLKNFVIIGIGGVLTPEHIQDYLSMGVDAVQSVTGVWVNPLLAHKYHQNR